MALSGGQWLWHRLGPWFGRGPNARSVHPFDAYGTFAVLVVVVLVELLMNYHLWIYAILFAVIFAETGLVVTPILPGDSLLFGVGALAAVAVPSAFVAITSRRTASPSSATASV